MPIKQVVGGVCRFTVLQHWTNNRKVANILDMHIYDEGVSTTREDAIVDQAHIISTSWIAHILPNQSNNVTLEGVRWLDLDTVDGITGEDTTGANTNGSVSAAACSPNVAALVSKTIHGTRGARKGRMYLVGMAEANINEDGVLVDVFGGDLVAFLAAINQDGAIVPPDYKSDLVVTHFLTPSVGGVKTGTYTKVDALVQETLSATQRRRLR